MMMPSAPTIAAVHHPGGRERLLKAARALFLLKGLDAVTVDDICLAASVSKGGFYHHFRNKEGVFLLVALEELGRELESLIHAVPGTSNTGSADALLLDLWSWAPRRARALRRVRNMHRRTLRELAGPGGVEAERGQAGGDREAQAMLALLLGAGRIARRALASLAYASERDQRKAAAG
jgi:AcrR family transcriptional regulator